MFLFGLTGGMGCGKSTVAAMFAQRDVAVFDADAIGKDILEKDSRETALVKAKFPQCITPSGTIDRRCIGSEVFASPEKRHWLEDLMHPAIANKVKKQIDELHLPRRSVAVLEGAVLIESRTRFGLSGMIVVTTPRNLRIERVMKRDGLCRGEIEGRLESQLPEWEKVLQADYLIDNAGSLEHTEGQVKNVLKLMFRQIGGVQ